ncbi:hypothetical protein SUGI_0241980 [Cryptomeria japonica]|nr:hypothetical protein SUGI_0241980 [Cryptomeria japonica]
MPNLVSLHLHGNKGCTELPMAFGKSGGFPQLRFFRIWEFTELVELPELEEGAMPCLEELEIVKCPKLNEIREGLEWLKEEKDGDFRIKLKSSI